MSSSARVSASGFSFAMTATLCMITPPSLLLTRPTLGMQ